MGLIQSATTVYARAYLTELGRQYLFDATTKPRYITLSNGRTVDRLKITRFSLGDPDVNYQLPLPLTSGDIPDLSGENENAVTGAKGRSLTNLISPGNSAIPPNDVTKVSYKTTFTQLTFDSQVAPSTFPTVTTQQLQTFVDGALINDGIYYVSPTSYGPNVMSNNELIIPLKAPTLTSPGYRLRIFYPSSGMNQNKMTFQFEKASQLQGTPVTTVSTTVRPATVLQTTGAASTPVQTSASDQAQG